MKDILEKVAENSFLANKLENSNAVEKAHYIAGFREGATWQQERSYSEEEVKNLLNKRLLSVGIFSSDEATNIWFKQCTKTI